MDCLARELHLVLQRILEGLHYVLFSGPDYSRKNMHATTIIIIYKKLMINELCLGIIKIYELLIEGLLCLKKNKGLTVTVNLMMNKWNY